MPAEADPPLIIDPDTVLPGSIALELLQTIARWRPEILELLRGVEHHELSEHEMQELGGKAPDPFRCVADVGPRTNRLTEDGAVSASQLMAAGESR